MAQQKDGVENAPPGAGEGRAYPNPHTGKKPEDRANISGRMGHGGQSEIGYHGHGQAGADEDADGNDNAPTKEG